MTSLDANPAFDVAVERRERMLVASPAGELDLATAPLLLAALRSHFEEGDERLVIDLRQLSFMDSSGLRLLVSEADRAQRDGYELTIVRGGAEVSRLVRLTRLDEKLPFADSID
ncbi:STAS domain-containing protein [Conexibacter sp. JD483]|uniref:STAS domain-containing protein n=1 Tax=unclassified Conexibacter TaxID=2627773 RepID=UPI002722EE06|nr:MULTISPECIES: STAS domain-containing protein [unclassified Conexibacter]MDO8185409.1 STAS domain-containing protein [Conexibacter sp. CPCC 205706]MDO8198415.1 STAS domain-containing protein [Conexibacter sp. CPCC 205762]MDR9369377.1 STAS domain-containing protein [Conexibacter sp. JD483]